MITDTYYLYGNKPMSNCLFVIGRDCEDCITQLAEYGTQHPEKWIYYYDCGTHPGKPIPVAERHFEVHTYDKKPAGLMIFYTLFQEGSAHEEEESTSEMRMKQLQFFHMIGSSVLKGDE